MNDKTQRLVLSIIDFLNTSIDDGTIKQDDREGLEVAVQCIGEAFGVEPANDEQRNRLSIKPASLQSIFDIYLKTRDKHSTAASSSASAATPHGPPKPTAVDRAQAEKHKQSGNAHMTNKQYPQAIDSYTQAIALDPTNPVYYSNRAAAHSSSGDHSSAITDAEKAIAVDPAFTKAYHRLGHAHFSQQDYSGAVTAFKRGLDLEPGNANLKSGYEQAKARLPPDEDVDDNEAEAAPRAAGAGSAEGGFDFSQLANMFGSGSPGGAGGMPDLASLMSNPALMNMAQQMMANGGIERMMSNPTLQNMMNRAQGGGGMPSMSEIMADPSLRELASQFMGGAAGAHPPNPPS